ncbi:MAG: hypothetical protein V4644_03300 [Patescibacteria group bacterium]
MRYFLDFDRTVFDTEAFKAYVRDLPGNEALQACSSEELTPAIYAMEDLTFEPGELSRFLYQDAASFLREKENAVTIITYGKKQHQQKTTKSALHGIPRMSIMYTDFVRKGDFLAPHTHLHTDALLVDDTPEELEILARECPKLTLYEMRRDGRAGDGRWPVVISLATLP